MAIGDIHITDAELQILQILWQRKQATVKEVHEALGMPKATGYTTTLKQMQVMHEKGLLKRDEAQRQHIYKPVPSQTKVQRRFTGKLLDSIFGGSPLQLVLHALSQHNPSPEELEQIQSLIDQVKKDSQK